MERLRNLAVTGVIALALGAAVPVFAEPDHGKCQRSIEKAEAKLDQAVRRHGERSRQAEQRRRDLNAERERCFNRYHGWWDGHEHRWHEDRDWR